MFGREGASLAIGYRQREDLALEIVEEIRVAGQSAMAVQADVADHRQTDGMVQAVLARWGRIDVLLNSAGVLRRGPVAATDPEAWDAQVRTNIWGTIYATAAVAPHMIERRYGRIINMASPAAQAGWENGAVYAGTKGFMVAYTKSLALELGPFGVTANCVGPSGIITDMNRDMYTPEYQRTRAAQLPVRHLGEVEDVAYAALTFADVQADYLTGQILYPTGGMVMGL
jgi:3-oxoacyl-[acyl-carrier protein] reductase